MARLKIAYIGGGSTRAPGTMLSFAHQGANFDGSEFVLVDLDPDRLEIVRKLTVAGAAARGLDFKVRTVVASGRLGDESTARLDALRDCDAVLTSFRPGGFEARVVDEAVPLKHGVIGQETQGPGGFFMALRSIAAVREIVHEMERVCPNAWLDNYTNPINIVSQAVTRHSSIKTVSLCEGPIIFADWIAQSAGLGPAKLDATMIGLNHACWSVRHDYNGVDVMPLIEAALEVRRKDPSANPHSVRMLELAVTMQSIPADYFRYYYFMDEELAALKAKSTTRAQDILAKVPGYWEHYTEQSQLANPVLDPATSRGGINELELALDVMDAIFNDRKEVLPVNVPNHSAIVDFDDDLVVEVPGYVDKNGIKPLVCGHMPRQTLPLLKALGEYQYLAAEAAWSGRRRDAIRALMANPLVLSLHLAEAIYDEMASELRSLLPGRLLKG